MNEEIKNFLINNFSSILSIIAICISILNFVYLYITNRKKLNFSISSYTVAKVNGKNFYMFNVEFINKSRLPISVNEITFIDSKNIYKIDKAPQLLAEKNTKRGNEVIKRKEINSAKFPINLLGLCSEQKFIVMHGPEDFKASNIKVMITTNRGKVTKKIAIKERIVDSNTFTTEQINYCE